MGQAERQSRLAVGRRVRAIEPLESRRMLALTIITPGEGDAFPDWAYDMATAIVAREGVYDQRDADGDGIADIVQNAKIDLNGERQLVGSGQIARDLLLFDWTAVSAEAGSADSEQVTQVLNDWVEQNVFSQDVHFIGQGRGALVNMAVLRHVSNAGSWRFHHVQMTSLDAYSRGDDGALEANPGGLVAFADNYYQDIDPEQLEHGAELLGALNFHLNDQLAGWSGRTGELADHDEVHDWYHWTIDSATVTGDAISFADAELPVPSGDDRASIYDGYVADLNADGQPDDFNGGARLGYYFTLSGGGIGTAILVFNAGVSHSVYTLDVRTGELPLYLGRLAANPPEQIAYRPTGDLYYTDFRSQLTRAHLEFDANNEPEWTETNVGLPLGMSFPYALKFSSGGRLARAEADLLIEIHSATGEIVRFHRLDWGQATTRTVALEHNDNVLVIRMPLSESETPKLVYFNTITLEWLEVVDIPYRDVIQLSMIDGLLYAFREEGQYFTINLMTHQIVERGNIALPEGVDLRSMSSATNLTFPRWHNREMPYDVDGNGRVNASDVLTLINTLLLNGPRSLDTRLDSYELFSSYFDVTHDWRVNTSDVLAVINQILLNSAASAPPATPLAATPLAAVDAALAPASGNESVQRGRRASSVEMNWIAFAAAIEADDARDDAELW